VHDFESKSFSYRRSADQDAAQQVRHPVVVVGAGPVGLTLAIDLALQGIACVLLDDEETLSSGSRAICFAKRTLDIFDRLGAGEEITSRGVIWHVGKVFFGDELIYQFDLAPEAGQRRPAFINLQQYVVEGLLVERALALPNLDLRFGQRVKNVSQDAGGVNVEIETPEGTYAITAAYLVACDGARSTVRTTLGLNTEGRTFRDRFLIADVRMRAPFPAERWFWFDPPFHRNQSALLHRQPDDIWRIDFQLGWDADPQAEKEPERVRARVTAMLGEDVEFDLVWVSVYTFACQRMQRFVHDRIIFAGDSAHGVSPFGARGANSGIQDADNLAWKLARVIRGHAPHQLIETYHLERSAAADENIRHSTRSTDFITPKSAVSRVFRDAALRLARHYPFARQIINSGRLSSATDVRDSPLTARRAGWLDKAAPGTLCSDAPLTVAGETTWLLSLVGGRFSLLLFCDDDSTRRKAQIDALQTIAAKLPEPVDMLALVTAKAGASGVRKADPRMAIDREGIAFSSYGAPSGGLLLVRPDQYIAASYADILAPKLGGVVLDQMRQSLALHDEEALCQQA
jgi:3-(3-hydroxy-phenyl)propionate hydroxylase